MDITGRRPEDSGNLSYEMPATDLRYPMDQPQHNATVSSYTGLASVGEQIASRRIAIFGHIARLSEEVQPTRLSVPSSTYHLVACLVGTGSVVLVDQTTDGSIRFATTPATCPRRYGDQPFFVVDQK